jgi:Protein of unknown function (DUF1569)
MTKDTRPITHRRVLHFNDLNAALADADPLAAAHSQGKLRTLGAWTPGQIFGHLSAWVDYSFDGVPLKIPFFVRWMLRPMKNRMLYKPMRPGARIPRVSGGTLGREELSFDEGLDRFRRAFTRLKTESPRLPHLIFGPLTHDEWINQHLRHAELHLSFMRAD